MFTRDSIQHHKESGKDACLMCMDFSWELTTKLLSEDTLEFQVPDLSETHLAENQHLHTWLWYIMIIPSRTRCLPGFFIGWIRGNPRIIPLGISWHPTFPGKIFATSPLLARPGPREKVDVVSFATKLEACVASWVLAVEALNSLQVVTIETGLAMAGKSLNWMEVDSWEHHL